MSDLPSRMPSREAAGQAVAWSYRYLKGAGPEVADLVALGIHWSTGRLVDRDTFDREAMRNTFWAHAADLPLGDLTGIDRALDLALVAAIGGSDEK